MAAAPKAPDMPLPMYWNLVAGSIAGVSELLVMYPLDVAKTRLQLQTTTTGPDAYTSIGDVFRKIVRQEGPRALYRGILPPILVEAPKRAIKFSANDAYKRAFQEKFGIPSSTLLSIATGVSAGITEAFIVGPPELLKIKLQDKRNAGKYSGASDVVRQIVRAEGYLGLTRGLEATIWRHALWNGGYFGVIQSVRSALPEPETHQGALLKNFIAGTVGGIVGTTINTPTDVAKTRIQGAAFGETKYRSAWQSVALIAREEGPRALYKGYLPKVLRLGPGGGILLVVFDFLSGQIRKHLM